MNFFANYGVQKAKQLMAGLSEAIVKFDPEAATEAAIVEIEQKFDTLNLSFSKAKKAWEKEQKEADTIVALYNQRLAAAEFLQTQEGKKTALEKMLNLLEEMLPDLEREKQEAQDAREDMGLLEGLVTQYAEKLKSARKTVEAAKQQMERSEAQKQRAVEMADAAAMTAGLTTKTSELSDALTHMENLAAKAQTEADAAMNKAKLLRPTHIEEEDADIKAAMDAVSGTVKPVSVVDRLAALKQVV